ncbi:phosphoribosylglycinamide formyltransferase [Vibrio sp. S11_S32]|uniref:phosphoribosylglycinamide formyltransferase n=1 Tax=Vibrio sp. S11_S32 TaxID=2720225 RepID=UPI00168196C4|nr:phosphoribosylglycinamide formyltransferase [Vibrio sp. S11_S32]MBD1576796.1 phosphoribosylglycinamide formyltransferase [Vibrio sp. S11_S32]
MKKVAFLFSGRGSLLTSVQRAIKDCDVDAELSLILTNNHNFSSDDNPIFSNLTTIKVSHRDFMERSEFEDKIAEYLNRSKVDLIILGGFRRIFSPGFVKKFGHKTMNTHPSLLPAFPGDKAQLKALQAGLKVTGATLHFINDEVDAGPIIDQEPVRITSNMTESSLREVIIDAEKEMIYRAVYAFLEGKIELIDNQVIYEECTNV